MNLKQWNCVSGAAISIECEYICHPCSSAVDCWDGPDGEPIIHHGYTLTSKILFKDVIETINKYAFTKSQYAVLQSNVEVTNLSCMTSSSPLQVPGDFVHREPLHCASAEENGRISEGGAAGEAGPVQRQHTRMQKVALPRNPQRKNLSQGEIETPYEQPTAEPAKSSMIQFLDEICSNKHTVLTAPTFLPTYLVASLPTYYLRPS